MLRDGRIGSEELTRLFIARIEEHDDELNAIVVRDFDRALDAARAADAARARGESLGRLHGLPMTIKESYDIAGLPTTWGDPAAKDNRAQRDAVVVERFKGAGAHFLGKTNVPLNLADFQTFNAIHGTTHNPWRRGHTPGGSSGGSAVALATGMTALESGSDIGGSIRNPAHFCGVYGHKPTLGIVPTRGHQPPGVPQSAQDPDLAVVGPLARSAEDLALAMEILAGPDVLEAPGWKLELPPPRATSLADLRVALWPDDPLAPVSEQIAGRIREVGERLAAAGATVSDTARPAFPTSLSHQTYLPLLDGMMAGPEGELKYFDWMGLHGRRGFLREQWRQFFEQWDVVLCPISTTTAFPQDEEGGFERTLRVDGDERPYFEQVFWAGLATVAYLPATVFPTGLSEDGLPIGVQAIGPAYGDRTTIEVARLMAQEIGGFQAPPGYGG
ncbi:MAG: amidase [Acidobacteria bacterium]|nr:MAG: amidase [Acidobacteriota bacterium]REK11125.1 MAG: amidase [Acidobacteriota bacterium]